MAPPTRAAAAALLASAGAASAWLAQASQPSDETCSVAGGCNADEDPSTLLQTVRRPAELSLLTEDDSVWPDHAGDGLSCLVDKSKGNSWLGGISQGLKSKGCSYRKHRPGTKAWWCPGMWVRPVDPAQTASFYQTWTPKTRWHYWSTIEPLQDFDMLERLNERLTKVEPLREPFTGLKQGRTNAKDAMDIMYQATTVPGNIEDVPEKLRGVFWMKGNGAPEELAVFQYGKWDKEANTYWLPAAPFNWAFPAGKPKNAPFDGALYSDDDRNGLEALLMQSGSARAYSFKFEDANLRKAYMQVHNFGDVEEAVNVGDVIGLSAAAAFPDIDTSFLIGAFAAAFDFNENQGSTSGTSWKRGCYWGLTNLSSKCAFYEFGSYELVKVVDHDGKPVMPYYDEFVEYMGDVELMMWSGFTSKAVRDEVIQEIDAYLNNSTDGADAGGLALSRSVLKQIM